MYARYEALANLREFVDRPTVAIGEAAERAFVDDAPDPEAQTLRAAEVAEAAARVEELLGQLTPSQAHVLRATKLADAEPDTETAARELGITASSVRTAQTRAMARLRELCGTRSPNPLASAVPEAQRRQAAWAERTAARRGRAHGPPSPRRPSSRPSSCGAGSTVGCRSPSWAPRWATTGPTCPRSSGARRGPRASSPGGSTRCWPPARPSRTATAGTAPTPAERAGNGAPTPTRPGRRPAPSSTTRRWPSTSRTTAPAETACAAAHAAVQAAAGHAQAEEAGAGHAAGDHDEQARAAQLARWHADDQETATTDSTADANGRVGVVGMTAPCQPAPPPRPTTDSADLDRSGGSRAVPFVWSPVMTTGYLLATNAVAAVCLVLAYRRRAWLVVAGLALLELWFARQLAERLPLWLLAALVLLAVGVAWHRFSRTSATVTRWGARTRRKSGVASTWDVARVGSGVAMRRKAATVRPSLS